KVNNVAPYVTEGECKLAVAPVQTAIAGSQLLAQLGLDVNNVFSVMEVFYPNPKATPAEVMQSPDKAFRSIRLRPDGSFTVQDDFDAKYVLADIGLVQGLLQEDGNYSSIEIAVNKGADIDDVKEKIEAALGTGYLVQTRFDEN